MTCERPASSCTPPSRARRRGPWTSAWSCRRATSTNSRAGNPAGPGHRIVELAQTAERLGFESIWTGEHVLSKWPGESIAFDCWALSSGLAPLVPRVGIGLIVMNSTFHNPAMTAKAASTLDAISGGRLTLGLGAGFKENEAAAFGHHYPGLKDRMEWLSEHFEIIWRATRQDEPGFSFEGKYARVDAI